MKKSIVFALFALLPVLSFAEKGTGFVETYFAEVVMTIALGLALVALLLLILTIQAVNIYKAQMGEVKSEKVGWFSRWWQSMNSFKPVEQEEVIMTNHEYDGIRELDNNLPPWWKWMFYLTIVFSVIYLFNFHVLGTGMTQAEEYDDEIAVAVREIAEYKARQAENTAPTEEPVTGPEAIAAGRKVYQKFCSACHGAEGQGGIGPNFSDQYWIHGGSAADIISTIEKGVPAKGMISWKNQLSGAEIQQVTAFILEFEGSNPEGQKTAEGELFEREAIDESTSAENK